MSLGASAYAALGEGIFVPLGTFGGLTPNCQIEASSPPLLKEKIMRFSSIFTVAVGFALAGGSAYIARDLLQPPAASATPGSESELVKIIVASSDIAYGQAIEARMLTTIDWPRKATPAGTFSDYSALLPALGEPPRRARRPISQGELILEKKISGFGEKVTIVQSIKPGHRAMAIKVTAETAVGGFVTPGDTVDVLLTQGRNESLRAVTILQNIRVIGVDQDADEQTDVPEIARTVTVEVTPEQGQRLALAQQAGTLSLTLRTLEATPDAPLELIRISDLMRDLSPVPASAPSRTVRIRRGTEVSVQEVN